MNGIDSLVGTMILVKLRDGRVSKGVLKAVDRGTIRISCGKAISVYSLAKVESVMRAPQDQFPTDRQIVEGLSAAEDTGAGAAAAGEGGKGVFRDYYQFNEQDSVLMDGDLSAVRVQKVDQFKRNQDLTGVAPDYDINIYTIDLRKHAEGAHAAAPPSPQQEPSVFAEQPSAMDVRLLAFSQKVLTLEEVKASSRASASGAPSPATATPSRLVHEVVVREKQAFRFSSAPEGDSAKDSPLGSAVPGAAKKTASLQFTDTATN